MTYFGVMDCEGRLRFAARNMARVTKLVTAGRQNADLYSVLFRYRAIIGGGTRIVRRVRTRASASPYLIVLGGIAVRDPMRLGLSASG